MEIRIPEFCLVMMIGPASSGKTTLARAHFADSEIVASDHCRYVMSGDGSDQSATKDAFALLRFIVGARLRNRRLTVVDATNLRAEDRRDLLTIARDNDCQTEALVMDTPRDVCLERNEAREDRQIHSGAVRRQYGTFRQGLSRTRKEGFHRIHRVKPEDTAEGILFVRERMRSDLREQKGPFDIIGDVHGCHEELMELLGKLGYTGEIPAHPEGRRAVFLGDLADRGPASDRVLETVMDMTEAGSALCVMGNHENKLVRSLRGNAVSQSHGLSQTMEQLERRDEKFRERVKTFLGRMDTHYVMDGGELAVAHAGVIQAYQNRASGRVRNFCLYGQTTGESDEWGLPVRQDWAQDYRGEALVVYGHTTVDQPGWFNNTINVDTGCVFGGFLTALRYPERELVQVSAHAVHYEPAGPPRQARTGGEGAGREREPGDETTPSEAGGGETGALHIEDVDGSRAVDTRTRGRITVRRDRAEAALETMSRFAVDPRWLVYLPPTISPTEASDLPDMLEHPAQAFDHYRRDGVESVVCEEKHMGSRGIIVIGRDEKALARALGIRDPLGGMCYTRTGRRFFIDGETERKFMDGARAAIGKERALGRAGDGLGRHGLGDHALVPQGRTAAPLPLRPRRNRRAQHPPQGGGAPGDGRSQGEGPKGGRAGPGGRGDRGDTAGRRPTVPEGLPAVLLEHGLHRGSQGRALPHTRLGGPGAHRNAPHLAHGDGRKAGPGGPGPVRPHGQRGGGPGRPRAGGERHPLVGAAGRRGRRGHGGQTRGLRPEGKTRQRPARDQGAGSRVPQDNLRDRVQPAGQHRTDEEKEPGRESGAWRSGSSPWGSRG